MAETDIDSFDVLEPRIERLMGRFHLPPSEAQTILDEIMLAMLTKRDRIRDPERWLLRTLKSRCRIYWRERRRRLYRVVDRGVLSVLASDARPDEKNALRDDLTALLVRTDRESRELLSLRYGLIPLEDDTPALPTLAAGDSEAEVLRAVAALARSFRRGPTSLDPDDDDDDGDLLGDLAGLEGFG
jgi:hypothetical protein